MRLYLVQHGEATSKEEDAERPLTEEGGRNVGKSAAFLAPLSLRVSAIWHSGKRRAVDTAEILAESIEPVDGFVAHEGLSPKDAVKPVAKEIERFEGDLMIVGHLPFLASLAGFLLSGDKDARPAAFRNGGVVCLEKGEEGWQVAWAVTPDILP